MNNYEYSIMKGDDESSEVEHEYIPSQEPQELAIEGYEVVFDKKVSLMPAELVSLGRKRTSK